MDCVHERKMRNISAKGSEAGIGINAKNMAEGRWVKTIVYELLDDDLEDGASGSVP